jgi:phospholipid/cholesterol/gamma-HCH transport system substrate-binding protein
MPRFREFPPLLSASVGLILVAIFLIGAFAYPRMPWVAGHTYHAEVSDGGGLKVSDLVEVAGIEVGQVTGMELDGNKVLVSFTAKKVRMADNATAAIKSGTLLGKRFLSIDPGTGPEMKSNDTIPLARTSTPYNVSHSIEEVTQQIHDFDKPKIEAALNSFSDAFQDTPANFRATFENVKALSLTISSRDDALRQLLAHANGVSGVLADRTDSFRRILLDGNRLLAELQARQELFHELFRNFNYVAEQARHFVRENNRELGPSLDELNSFLAIIEHNNANLQLAIQRVSSFIGGLGEGIANGPLFSVDVNTSVVGNVFNVTDLFRQIQNPQAPRIAQLPCGPGGIDLPNPLAGPPSGTGTQEPLSRPTQACGQHNPATGYDNTGGGSSHGSASHGPALPGLGGN